MATITTAISSDYLQAYDGYNQQKVGIGLQTGNYASPEYAKKKIQNLAIGLLSECVYSGFEVDPTPLMLPIAYEGAYNTILALNLHYVPESYRRAIMKFILDSNAARIRANQSMIVDWHALKRAIPIVQYITRRYKTIGIRVKETFALNDVPKAINQSSPYSNHYRTLMG